MPRAIWSGAISFGLVNIPVKLVTAVDRKNVRFRELRRSDASRVRYRKVAASDGEEVAGDEMVKGFEIAPDRYVVLEPDELKALAPESSRAIEIEDFVELADIEPLYYDSSYYLVPGDTAAKPYALLHTAMRESGKAAVARFVLRTKQHLAIIRPEDFLGELALLDDTPRSASARAAEKTEALAFFREDLNELVETQPAIAVKIMKDLAVIIGQRLKAANEQLMAGVR